MASYTRAILEIETLEHLLVQMKQRLSVLKANLNTEMSAKAGKVSDKSGEHDNSGDDNGKDPK